MLVGRAIELDRIQHVIAHARNARGGSLIIRGDPGIGKSALLDEAALLAPDFDVLRVRSLQSESHLPFVGLFDLLTPLLPYLDAIPSTQQASLKAAFALGPPAPGDRFAAGAATISLLAAAAGRTPVLCLLDDAQWLDKASRESLLFAARRLRRDAVVVLFAMRDRTWADDIGIDQLHLTGLMASDANALLDQTGRRISDEVRTRLIVDTGGSPLALQGAVQSLSDDQLAGVAAITGPVAVGHEMERTYAQRLVALSAETRLALLVAATSNSGSRDEVTSAMSQLGLEATCLEPAEHGGLLTAVDGRWEFDHPLVRSAAYHAADQVDRRRAHEALARTVSEQRSDEVAWHLASAAVAPDEEIARRLEDTAGTSWARHGYVGAAQALVASARLSPQPEEAFRRMLSAATAFRSGGQHADAEALLEDALDLARGPEARADAQLARGFAMLHGQPSLDVCEMLASEADRIEPVDPGRAAAMLAAASVLLVGAADVQKSLTSSTRALSLASVAGGPVLLVTGVAHASALTLSGRTNEAKALLTPAVPVLGTLDPLSDLGLLIDMAAHCLVWLEEWTMARQLLEKSIASARSAGAASALPHPLAILSELDYRCGRMAQALAASAESAQIANDTDQTLPAAIALISLARDESLLGRRDDAGRHLDVAVGLAGRLGVDSLLDYVSACRSLGELGAEHPERALPHARDFVQRQKRKGVQYPDVVRGHADFVEALIRTNHTSEAIVELARLEERALSTESRWASATAARCQGLLASDRSYESAFDRAFALHSGADLFEISRTWLCLGQRRLSDGRVSPAREALENALAGFESLGSRDWANQAGSQLQQLGGAPRQSAGSVLSQLTPQEIQVALIVAEGATNAEAAAALFISPRTVEAHLSRVYRKLDVRSRTELSRRIRPDG